jgi:hypothetical protein
MLTMNFDDFVTSLDGAEPPEGLPLLAVAMWWAGKGDWNRAHEIAQEVETPEGAWVHAYLHRKEGDDGNAEYWYQQAGRPHSRLSSDDEWDEISRALLA